MRKRQSLYKFETLTIKGEGGLTGKMGSPVGQDQGLRSKGW